MGNPERRSRVPRLRPRERVKLALLLFGLAAVVVAIRRLDQLAGGPAAEAPSVEPAPSESPPDERRLETDVAPWRPPLDLLADRDAPAALALLAPLVHRRAHAAFKADRD